MEKLGVLVKDIYFIKKMSFNFKVPQKSCVEAF